MTHVKLTPLSQEEFYQKLDEIVPGKEKDEIQSNSIYKKNLFLERMSLDGLKDMFEYSKDPKMYDFFEFAPHQSIQDTEKYLKNILAERMGSIPFGRKAMYWFVKRKVDGVTIGSMTLANIDLNRLSAEWGYAIGPKYWGNGYILEMQETLKDYVFNTLKLNRINGTTRIDNEPTKSSVLAAGAKFEGVLRQYYRDAAGNFHDAWQYSLLRDDYIKEKMEQGNQGTLINEEALIEIINKVLQEPELTINSDMTNTYSWDSLTHLDVIVEVEASTGFKFSPAEMAEARSISKIHEILRQKA